MRRLPFLLSISLVAACSGELVTTAQPGADGGGGGGPQDETMTYRPAVQSEFERAGCMAAACHGNDAVPMPLVSQPSSEDDWRANYNQVRARAGTATSSLLLAKATGAGGHVAGLSPDDPVHQRLQQWIAAGAPYDADAGGANADAGTATDAGLDTTDGSTAAGLTWERDIDPIMRARCTRCHGTSGAYSVESYDGARGFGRDGVPNILPGDPTSLLAQYVEQGHEGINVADALTVVTWIVDWAAAER